MARLAWSSDTAKAVEQRAAQVQASLDPRALWPELTREILDLALRDIAQATRLALAGGPERPALRASTPAQAHALGIAAFISGMGPLLGYWVERAEVQAAPEVAATLRGHREQALRRHQMLASRLGDVLQSMAERGVTPILLKGMHTGWQYLPQPGTRTISDIDLLVPPGQLARASEALRATGLVQILSTASPFRSAWAPAPTMAIHSVELDHADNPWSVDLHITLERRYARGVTASLGFRGSVPTQPFTVDGRPAQGLAQPWLAASLALHASYAVHALQLVRLVELILVIRRDLANGTLQPVAWAAFLATTGTTRFVYPALELTEHLAPGTISDALLGPARAAASSRSRRVVRAMIRHGGYRLPRRSLDERLMWASGPREGLLTLTELLWPSDSSLGEAVQTLRRRMAGLSRGWFGWRAG